MARKKFPIEHWSYSSLVTYLRNPLAWYKRYVEGVYDIPGTSSSVLGRAGHKALEHFYSGAPLEVAIQLGLEYLQSVPDYEINLGQFATVKAKKVRRKMMEAEYKQAINFYLERPPRHKVLGVEVKKTTRIPGIDIPIKAISDLVVVSSIDKNAVDIVDHKFVASFSGEEINNPLFVIQALFNYYTVLSEFNRPVKRFIVYECKKTKNKNGKPQLRKNVIDFMKHKDEFELFYRLLRDATKDIRTRKVFLPNPSDIFEGKDSLDIYRWNLVDRA
jgi:hypothetical protein